MNMNRIVRKKWFWVAVLVAVILGAVWLYGATIPSVTLCSEQNDWKAMFYLDDPSVLIWKGILIYEGDEEVRDISVELFYNG